MAPTTRGICHFFAQGLCRNGEACSFIHEKQNIAHSDDGLIAPPLLALEKLNLNPSVGTRRNVEPKDTPVCTFFVHGLCNKGDKCWYLHPLTPRPPQHFKPETESLNTSTHQTSENAPQTTSDSRATIPCTFYSSTRGCRNDSCPYLHAADGFEVENSGYDNIQIVGNAGHEIEDDFIRDFSGVRATFGETGQVLKLSLPADFSIACISGLDPSSTPETVVGILRRLGFEIKSDNVRTLGQKASPERKVVVKVENPLFAKQLHVRLNKDQSGLSATTLPTDSRQSNCRKVYISWHKATRSVWLNFGNGDIADRVAQKFNDGRYKVDGRFVKCSAAKRSSNRGMRRGNSHNPVAWTATLSDVPSWAAKADIEAAIRVPLDAPRHIELGSISYLASDPEVSITVRSCLEDYGPLEGFHLASGSKGKRSKAAAWFREEEDAVSACSLNNKRLSILGNGKLTVTMVHSAKVRVQTEIYSALKGRIEKEGKAWKGQHLSFHAYVNTAQGFTTLKFEGDNAKEVARARSTLDQILNGVVLRNSDNVLWSSTLITNGIAYQRVKVTERKLDVVIRRNKTNRQLLYYGPSEKLQETVAQVTRLLKEESSTCFEIDLNPQQFSRTVRHGFKRIEKALGKDVVTFNVVSKRVMVTGTQGQYEMALALINGEHSVESQTPTMNEPSSPRGNCPICFCEADNPVRTSCKHTYCLEYMEDYCKSAASTSHDEFQLKCQGSQGTCTTIFTLRELKDLLSSSVFETMLKSSFEEYVQRHPNTFHYCPTPDCGYIYRCAPASTTSKPPPYRCPNCFEPICTFCHARHGNYTCAEYKDIASGGYEALEKLKKELNIKDCPKCTTPIEKTEGCNHITCRGCKAHICWVCMAVFETSGPCYDHMNKAHGGNGLGPPNLMFW